MFYTIMTTRDVQGDQSVDLNKNGNQYNVYFSCPSGQANKDFASHAEALKVYMRYVECFAEGTYSEQDRMGFLK